MCVWSRSSGCANCATPPTSPQILRPGSLLPPRSKDHPLKPITFHERKPKSLRRENARKYKLLFGILEERRTVDEENGEIHVALLLLCPLIVKCNSLWVLRLA